MYPSLFDSASSSHRSDSPKRRSGEEQTMLMMFTLSRACRNPKAKSRPDVFLRVQSVRSTWPPVLTESLHGLKEAPPELAKRLGDQLDEGVGFGFVTQGLQHIIKNNPEVGYQTIKLADFDRNNKRSTEELAIVWKEAKKTFLNERDCKDDSRDENAWCINVLLPLVYPHCCRQTPPIDEARRPCRRPGERGRGGWVS